MLIKTVDKPIIDHRAKTVLWLTLSALIFFPPFAVNNFFAGRIITGWVSVLVILILVLQAWTIYKGGINHSLNVAGLVPVIIILLVAAFYYQRVIGAFWYYPAILLIYFILPRRKAIYVSIYLLLVVIPSVWLALENALAIRIAVTLLAVSIFSAIFVLIIEQQQQEMEKKEARRRHSITSVAHEIRTPLATTLAQTEAMRDGIRPLDKDELAMISRSVEHITSLVDDIYLLSLDDISALSVNKRNVLIAGVVDDALTAMKSKLAKNSLQVVNSVDPDISLFVDPNRLRQIIDNLLENCCRYTAPDGIVFISAQRQQLMLELTIADSGPGVDDEQLQQLFERFYRADKSRSYNLSVSGSGLGLSLVKALAEAHGGYAKAQHAEQGGLSVSVFFPLAADNGRENV